jgi:hypothetical protein
MVDSEETRKKFLDSLLGDRGRSRKQAWFKVMEGMKGRKGQEQD